MISILFFSPKMNGAGQCGALNSYWDSYTNQILEKIKWKVFTPSLLLLAAIAEEEGCKPYVADEEFGQPDNSIHYDIVCFYTVTPNVKRAYYLAEKYRRGGSWIVMGGVHSSALPDESAAYCDTLIIGEGEYTFRQFLKDFKSGAVKKLYRQELAAVDLKLSPPPLYRVLSRDEQRLIPMQTSRGCSRNCQFCNVRMLYGNQFRVKSASQIQIELNEIDKLPYAKNIYITDDNIVNDDAHFKTICEIMGASRFLWYANSDISFGGRDADIKEAYKSGLRQILIGLESIFPEDLAGIDDKNFKFRHREKYKEYIHRIQSNGIGVTGSFIVGQENNTPEIFGALREFIYESCLYAASVTMYTPYPGTRLFDRLKQEGRIKSFDWDDYTIFQPVIETRYLSDRELSYLYMQLIKTINNAQFLNNKKGFFTDVYKKLKFKK
ncbi:MAG: B12-binding domain-containing radical SAM protein [Defluviitaleaceae bacterium]|nr:B12-binding domain-containing radical SAM protein [Defluviitaleaceae bacterium]